MMWNTRMWNILAAQSYSFDARSWTLPFSLHPQQALLVVSSKTSFLLPCTKNPDFVACVCACQGRLNSSLICLLISIPRTVAAILRPWGYLDIGETGDTEQAEQINGKRMIPCCCHWAAELTKLKHALTQNFLYEIIHFPHSLNHFHLDFSYLEQKVSKLMCCLSVTLSSKADE